MRIFVKRAEELQKDARKPRARFPARQVILSIVVVIAIVLVLRFALDVRSGADLRDLILTIVRTIRRG
jgi:hypothetical protein